MGEFLYSYKFKISEVQFDIELSNEVIEYLGGKAPQKEKKQVFLARYGLNPLSRHMKDFHMYHYLEGYGYVYAEDWKKVLSEEFLNFQITITQWCYEHNVSRRFDRWLKENSESYRQHIFDIRYRNLIGKLTRGTDIQYGRLINKQKVGANYPGGNNRIKLEKSYQKCLQVLEERKLKPLFSFENWIGKCKTHGLAKELIYYEVQCKLCGTKFKLTFGRGFTINRCPCCVKNGFKSFREAEIKNYLESKGIKVFQSYKQLIYSDNGLPMEIDLYLPDYSLAIECNGFYYHSTTCSGEHRKIKEYHYLKREKCRLQGVRLVQYWEHQPLGLIKSHLMKLLNKLPKEDLSSSFVKEGNFTEFLNKNSFRDEHGFNQLGLFKGEELIAAISYHEDDLTVYIDSYAEIRSKVVSGLSKLIECFDKRVIFSSDLDTEDSSKSISGFLDRLVTSKRLSYRGNLIASNTLLPFHIVDAPLQELAEENNSKPDFESLGILVCYNSGVTFEVLKELRYKISLVDKIFDRISFYLDCTKIDSDLIEVIDRNLVIKIYDFSKVKSCENESLDVLNHYKKLGKRVIQFYQDDILLREDICLDKVLAECGELHREKVYARKCDIININGPQVKEFYNKWHIQGYGQGIAKALVYKGRIVSMMSVRRGPSNTSSDGAWELNRYASVSDIFVAGGFEKLFGAFTKEFHIHKWISYADKLISNGSLYFHQGWTLDSESDPDYKYVYKGERRHKFNFRIKRFKDDPELKYEEGMTERQLAELNKIPRIYDCGKMKFIKYV